MSFSHINGQYIGTICESIEGLPVEPHTEAPPSDHPNYSSSGCGAFAAYNTSCNYSGKLDVVIYYPTGNSEFTLYEYTGRGADHKFTALNITAGGTVLWHDDNGGGTDPLPSGGGGDDKPSKCPYYESTHPTCVSGSDGSITFILENTNYTECGLIPPYSGWVAQINELDDEVPEAYMWSPGPMPSKLSFYNLNEGLYKMSISGLSGTHRVMLVGLENQGGLELTQNIYSHPSSCVAADGVVIYSWSGNYSYYVEGTPYAGVSPTGFVASGLRVGDYHGWATDIDGHCDAEIDFRLINANPVYGTVETTGYNCTGAGNDGWAFIEGAGGTAPYTYRWLTSPYEGYTGQFISGLGSGEYKVMVYDANLCSELVTTQIGRNDNGLGVIATSNKEGNLVCCQAKTLNDLAEVSATAFGGTPPYTYLWDTTPPSTDPILRGIHNGLFSVTVTDSKGCSVISNPVALYSVDSCLKQKWTVTALVHGSERPDIFYHEKEEMVSPSHYDTVFPMEFLAPGEYVIRLMMADGFGRNGTDCVNIKIKPFARIPAIQILPPEEGETLDPGVYPTEPDQPIPPGPGPGPKPGPSHDKPSACCKLLSVDATSDGRCRTYCSSILASSPCNGSDALPAQQVAGKCEDHVCDDVWKPVKGACCLKKTNISPLGESYYTTRCVAVTNVCDTTNYCDKMALEAGFEFGEFHKDAKCDKSGKAAIDCGMVGACCPKPGEFGLGYGRVCLSNKTDEECAANDGDFLGHNSTCDGPGTVNCNDTKYCELYKGICCDMASEVPCKGEKTYCDCKDEFPDAIWTVIPPPGYGVAPTCESVCSGGGSSGGGGGM